MRRAVFLFCFIMLFSVPSLAGNRPVTDAQVRQRMIKESIAAYPGNCPCPYNLTRNGSRCGGRSAYSRAGGYSPLCYPSDISDKMVREYRKKHGIKKPEG